MNKPLFLFVGKSASGKTTIADMLSKDGYSQVYSYTTRPQRYEGEIGHTFISNEEYNKLENIVASTLYNGHNYCTTLDQVQKADIYVIDIPGVETLMRNYNKLNRSVCVIYFYTDVYTRIQRMKKRHDDDSQIIKRLINDEADDWEVQLNDLYHLHNYKFSIDHIDARKSLDEVYNVVKECMEVAENEEY